MPTDLKRVVRLNITRNAGTVGRVRVSFGLVYNQVGEIVCINENVNHEFFNHNLRVHSKALSNTLCTGRFFSQKLGPKICLELTV